MEHDKLLIILMIMIALIYGLVSKYSNILNTTFIGNLISSFPTLIHEFGHILFCKLFGGRVDDVVLNLRTVYIGDAIQGGYAQIYNKGRIGRGVSGYFGYPFPIIFFGIFVLLYINHLDLIWYGLVALIFLYYTFKTSKKIYPLTILLIIGGIFFLKVIQSEFFNPTLIMNIIDVFPFVFNGLLIGETLKYMLMLFKLKGNENYDGAVVKRNLFIPEIITIVSWYLIMGIIVVLGVWLMLDVDSALTVLKEFKK